ncbi:M20/M25/M40 family metallo-hydrolase [Olsenella sp. HMSC062G07]|uniref:M20/M25/M40 family metallo-hydrolase n=1 Tax=Olsenella sp. HMSC062G07 TaxID=1739330 RepID=UPI0008CCC78D|nr:M20/M25/M40 family metallo-hydrolase [Olsenella sp. HMSC062G07]OFK23397.1 hypothetical protein HMPREF2826_04760 [Olsenella sp. HMSC062G07]
MSTELPGDPSPLDRLRGYARRVHEDEVALLCELARIPAPTGHEERRAAFVADWLRAVGAPRVHVDERNNVLCLLSSPHGDEAGTTAAQRPLRIFAAHTDVVFDDVEALPLRRQGAHLCAPGVGDDSANLVGLLCACRYLLEHPEDLARATRDHDLLVVADAGEEGLGNLAGTTWLFDTLARKGRSVTSFVSFDLYLPQCVCRAVGSHRWRLAVDCQGGHSYHDAGRVNAIEVLCRAIGLFYGIQPPSDKDSGAVTTRNVGRIEGGGAVNAIAAHAEALVEYRSESEANLARMRAAFEGMVGRLRDELGAQAHVTATLMGRRPGNGPVEAGELERLTARSAALIRAVTGEEPDLSPASTDANVPLSRGIPANTVGTVRGALLHTRDEWVDAASLEDGLVLILGLMLGL